MPFIGKQPQAGAYSKLDSITTSATATYNLTLDSGAYYPQSANHLLVSLNGVIQAPQDSFTVSGSQIIFDSALTSADVIDFIIALGDTLDIGVPSAGSVNTSQLANDAVTTAKIAAGQVTSAKLDTNIDIAGTLDVTGTLTADSTGSVAGTFGIGTTSPGQTLEVNTGNDSNGIRIRRFSGSYYSDIVHTSSPEGLKFMVGDGSSVTERLRILGTGGITFNGDTAAANALDDYEEGTFTPTMSTASSYAVQQGFYTKVGRIVHCQITLQWVNSGTSTGSLGGLPFTVFGQNYATIMSREWYATGETWNANLNIGATGSYGFTYANNQSTLSNGGTYGIGLTFVYRVS